MQIKEAEGKALLLGKSVEAKLKGDGTDFSMTRSACHKRRPCFYCYCSFEIKRRETGNNDSWKKKAERNILERI